MNKRAALALATVSSVLVILLVAMQFFPASEKPPTAYPTPPPKGGMYLRFLNDSQHGGATRVFLINSQLYYGVYNESFTRSGATGFYSVNKGDPCVLINGTIQNEYGRDYYFAITAEVENSTGQKIGPILTVNSPQPDFAVAKTNGGSIAPFDLQIKYAGKDVVNYELFVAFEPFETPPP
jgi:hypothetical protein